MRNGVIRELLRAHVRGTSSARSSDFFLTPWRLFFYGRRFGPVALVSVLSALITSSGRGCHQTPGSRWAPATTKRGEGGARDPARRSGRRSTRELHTLVRNGALISASAPLESREVWYFSGKRTHAVIRVPGCRFLIPRKARRPQFPNPFDLPTVVEVKMIASHFPMEKFSDGSETCLCSLKSGAA